MPPELIALLQVAALLVTVGGGVSAVVVFTIRLARWLNQWRSRRRRRRSQCSWVERARG
jgi:hypothetical protein